MPRFIVFPYKLGSASAKRLAEGLETKRVRPDGRYRYRRGDVIINWGNSRAPEWATEESNLNTLNEPEAVLMAADKVETFNRLSAHDVPTLDFTTSQGEAQEWLSGGDTVYVRGVVNGHSGEGIQVLKSEPSELHEALVDSFDIIRSLGISRMLEQAFETEIEDSTTEQYVPPAPLYTKGKVNNGEYRVHVAFGEVIDYRKKSRRDGEPALEGQSEIRTLGNGWIFRQSNLNRLERVEELAIRAIDALGLDFGAVDILKDDNGDVFVVEVNTACAMDDETLDNYLTAFRKYARENE
jgi:hypothetical protein